MKCAICEKSLFSGITFDVENDTEKKDSLLI